MATDQVLPAVAPPQVSGERVDRDERREAFAEFYGQYYARVARYCFRLVREEDLARDLTQEAFAQLYIRWFGLRDPAAYLFHVASNLCRGSFTRAAREAVADAGALRERADHGPVHLAVSGLPRRYRELVLLYYFADLPVAEIAAVRCRPVGTVKRQLSRARELLAAELAELEG